MNPRVIKSKRLLKTDWFVILREKLRWPDGSGYNMHFMVKKPCVCVVAIYDGTILLVEQYRHTQERRSIEMPMGGAEEGEPMEAAARRELKEETGFRAITMKKLGSFFPAGGIMRQNADVFLAQGLIAGAAHRDTTEQDLRVIQMPLAEWKKKIRDGTISDGPSIAAWALYCASKEAAEE